MIDCIAVEDFIYFISLLGDIVQVISNELVIIHAEESSVIWVYTAETKEYCKATGEWVSL